MDSTSEDNCPNLCFISLCVTKSDDIKNGVIHKMLMEKLSLIGVMEYLLGYRLGWSNKLFKHRIKIIM